jgi:tRNA1Val (adenine37-N6)-methyltransferase
MKVGTDGILLGAIVDTVNSGKILDIGTGTGLIALMLGQRSRAQIDAMEIDKNAFQDASDNMNASPWKERVHVFHSSFQEFVSNLPPSGEKYDLVVSNPPYYHKLVETALTGRQIARHQHTLSDRDLFYYANLILKPQGSFWVIKPYAGIERFIKSGELYHLFAVSEILVRSAPKKEVSRIIIQFAREKKRVKTREIVIEKENGEYSDEYTRLTQDFYL